jgi:gas vesicle protein
MKKLFMLLLSFIGIKFLTLEEKVKAKDKKLFDHADAYYKDVIALGDQDYIDAVKVGRDVLQRVKTDRGKLLSAKVKLLKTISESEQEFVKEGKTEFISIVSKVKEGIKDDIQKITEKYNE